MSYLILQLHYFSSEICSHTSNQLSDGTWEERKFIFVASLIVPIISIILLFILFALIKSKVSKQKGNLIKSERNSLNLVFHEIVGKGSFGTVYKGSLNKQDVPVKVISRIRDSRGYDERNILHEQLGHENIVKILAD